MPSKVLVLLFLVISSMTTFTVNAYAFSFPWDILDKALANHLERRVELYSKVMTTGTDLIVDGLVHTSNVANHWAEREISELVEKGIMVGYSDGKIHPDEIISAAEFTTMVLKANGYKTVTSRGVWWEANVAEAARKGLVLPDEIKDYNSPIKRGQMARIIVRAMGIVPDGKDTLSYYTDLQEIRGTPFYDYLSAANGMRIVSGFPDGTFRYEDSSTRAEAAVMVERMLKKMVDFK